jgi:NAD(P)-dependent dehydrogenase (short-subunit alcohol dehydrogenase family)
VVVSGRREHLLDEVAAEHPAVVGHAADLSDAGAARGLVERAAAEFGGIDVLFHAAGVLRRNEQLADTTDDEWNRDLAINLTGVFNVVRPAIPHLVEARGSLILVASQLAHIAVPGYATYSAAKGGVLAMMRALAVDLGPSGVRVNALSPGVIETDMAYIGRDFAAIRDQVAAGIPLRRVGRPEDVTGAAVFLASDDASWMTGHSLVVDGGFTAQ